MPIAVSPIDGQLWTMLAEFLLEGGNQFSRLLVDGTLALEVVVVLSHRQQALAGDVSSPQHVFEEWNDVFAGFRTAKRDNENRIVAHADQRQQGVEITCAQDPEPQ